METRMVLMGFKKEHHGLQYFGQRAVEEEAACLLGSGKDMMKGKVFLPIGTNRSYPLSYIVDEDPCITRHSDSCCTPVSLQSRELPPVQSLQADNSEESEDLSQDSHGLESPYAALIGRAVEKGFQEAGERWLAKLLGKEVSPRDIVHTTCQGGALLLQVCNCMIVEIKLWLGKTSSKKLIHAAQTDPTGAIYKEEISIVSEFLSILVKSGILDAAGEAAAVECVEHLSAFPNPQDGQVPGKASKHSDNSKPVSSSHKKGSGGRSPRHSAAQQWRRSRYA
eukprot:gnl/MRDRNA2_/MRDRNA2_272834_c0_seq1.p1 gnl/MRDRNA2_/MRDRNA2_272834_c0~~gnl/MRDRNA2_/MRDRNA2_272834_c0_seq1.p1  ORF type:complete len:317 (-),score=64.48 gnl/MRDRNA2_/MRDRNA2_272834_c0_seq1:164-1003(-)